MRRGQARRAATLLSGQIALAAGLLLVWEVSAGRWIDPFWFSQPSAIFARLATWARSGQLAFHLFVTFQETALGFFWGALAGIALGFLLGMNPLLGRLVGPFLTALYTVPRIALAPLFVLWFGIGLRTKVVFSAVIVFFLVFYTTYDGVRNVDAALINVVRVMGATRRHILLKVLVPATLTAVFLGLRVAIPYALVGAVVGEIVASNKGLGFLLNSASFNFDTPAVFASIFVMMALSLLLHSAVEAVQRRVLRWKTTGQVDAGL